MYGAGHKFRTLHLPVSTTLAEVLDRVSGKFTTVCFIFKIVYMSLCVFLFCFVFRKLRMSYMYICSVPRYLLHVTQRFKL